MINKISGIIDEIINEGFISINCNNISYTVAVPGGLFSYLKMNMKIGDKIELYTIYYIENGMGGSALHPKLIGFNNHTEREFFEKYTTVKGLGIKSALKSLVISVKKIAVAIENGDIAVIKKLPGIGGRTAEKIIAELRGKLARYALMKDYQQPIAQAAVDSEPEKKSKVKFSPSEIEAQIDDTKINLFEIEEEVSQILADLGYNRSEISDLINKIHLQNIKFTNTEELLQEIFRMFKQKK